MFLTAILNTESVTLVIFVVANRQNAAGHKNQDVQNEVDNESPP